MTATTGATTAMAAAMEKTERSAQSGRTSSRATSRARRVRLTREWAVLIAIAILQVICAAIFVEDLARSVLGLRSTPVSWTWRELMEIFALFGLLLGMALAALQIRAVMRERRRAQETLRAASGEFVSLVQDAFDDWGLTPSERDVALFMLKGFANQEISALRRTSEGTIKAQATAVFRKAGVSGRPQLLSLFIEELLADPADSTGRDAREGS